MAKARSWRNRRVPPKSASSRLPPVRGTNLEGQQRFRFDPFTTTFGNVCYLRIAAVHCVVLGWQQSPSSHRTQARDWVLTLEGGVRWTTDFGELGPKL